MSLRSLTDEGLRGESWGASLRQYYAGIGSGTLDAAVAEMKATKEVRETRQVMLVGWGRGLVLLQLCLLA